MKQALIDELNKFFNPNNTLINDSRVKDIKGLTGLIANLNDPTSSPKEIAEQVEDVIVCIAIKNKNATEIERSLKTVLEDFQERLAADDIDLHEESPSAFSFK